MALSFGAHSGHLLGLSPQRVTGKVRNIASYLGRGEGGTG